MQKCLLNGRKYFYSTHKPAGENNPLYSKNFNSANLQRFKASHNWSKHFPSSIQPIITTSKPPYIQQINMKSIIHAFLALLLIGSSVAITEGGRDVATRRLKGTKSSKGDGQRQLKGSGKGKGSKGSKGSYDSTCDTMRVFYKVKDLKKHADQIDGASKNQTIGYTIDELPIFYMGRRGGKGRGRNSGGRKAGFLTEANIITGEDCSYTGVFSFDILRNGRSMDQIFYQGKFQMNHQ
jgi:hypothetical protein